MILNEIENYFTSYCLMNTKREFYSLKLTVGCLTNLK